MRPRRGTRRLSAIASILAGCLLGSCAGSSRTMSAPPGAAPQTAPLKPVNDTPQSIPDTMFADDSLEVLPPQDTIKAVVPEREDCDGNGVADQADIRLGTEDDTNHNGVIDPCDPDTSLFAHPMNTGWRGYRLAADTSFFWTGYQNRTIDDGGRLIAIRYTVPKRGARVRLEVFDARGANVATLVNKWQEEGFYESTWSRANANAKPLDPGVYRMRLAVANRTYLRRVSWAR